MSNKKENFHSDLLNILRNNINFSRRQVCQIGAFLGLAFYGFLPFQIRYALAKGKKPFRKKEVAMKLIPPVLDGSISLEKAIKQRRTVRSFANKHITRQQFSQIFWSAQGITEDRGFKRASPSGGALYPADIYAVVGENCVEGLEAGVYRYIPKGHSVVKVTEGDRRKDVAYASLHQQLVRMLFCTSCICVVSLLYASTCALSSYSPMRMFCHKCCIHMVSLLCVSPCAF